MLPGESSFRSVWVHVLTPLSVLANAHSGSQQKEGQGVRTTLPQCEPQVSPRSYWPGPLLPAVGLWSMNQWMGCICVYHSAFQKNFSKQIYALE